jgi:hypothetical protein
MMRIVLGVDVPTPATIAHFRPLAQDQARGDPEWPIIIHWRPVQHASPRPAPNNVAVSGLAHSLSFS